MAFVILGGLLLICLWITMNIHQSVMREFQSAQISVILKDGSDRKFKELVEQNSNVIRYDLYSAYRNKERLSSLYPDLKNVIAPLEEKFFPMSAVVSVRDADAFLKSLQQNSQIFESQILHQPPTQIRRFASVLTAVFGCLWLLTLSLVLYFNLERITIREEPRWSLMKMLGAKPHLLFKPLWTGQMIRICMASVFAILLAVIVSYQIEHFFLWTWTRMPFSVWAGFLVVSIGVTTIISFGLFYSRYRQVAIG